MNQHVAIASRLTKAALADIEGLDPVKNGFCRPELTDVCGCEATGGCGGAGDEAASGPSAVQKALTNTFEQLRRHIFVATAVPATEWTSKAGEVPGLDAIGKAVKGLSGVRVTAFHDPNLVLSAPTQTAAARHLILDWCETSGSMRAVDVRVPTLTATATEEVPATVEAPYAAADDVVAAVAEPAVAQVLSDKRVFVFVCAHRRRDQRCGYCGPVIVDLLRQAVAERDLAKSVEVFPCSHVGGHAYAGNVLVYGKGGGTCYGYFCPSDVDALANYLIAGGSTGAAPEGLAAKVRGHLTAMPAKPQEEAK